jgi:hypothetical protein
MKALPKAGLLVAVALLAAAAVATSGAQAGGFKPDNTAVSGLSGNFNLTY